MRLDRTAREWFALEIETTPAVDAWEASFDGGTTFVASTVVGEDGYSRWLVAGPDHDNPGSAEVLALGRTRPVIRAVDSPETIVRRQVPAIDVA